MVDRLKGCDYTSTGILKLLIHILLRVGRYLQRLLIIQATLVLVAIIAAISLLNIDALDAAKGALFGGCIALANSVLLYRKLDSASNMAKDNPNGGMMTLYAGVIQRFVFVLVMFGVGMGLLKLSPIALVGAFGLAQLAYMICGVRQQY